jgi:anti-sigma regulatory factor (Ser/Thr protein kinase)
MDELAAMTEGGIEMRGATPEWIEVSVPCTTDSAVRTQEYFESLDAGLAEAPRRAVGEALHELLFNAVEWGGKLNPSARVKVLRIRGKKMLLYRIADPGNGFRASDLPHAAISYDDDHRLDHVEVRNNRGLRAGGFGLLMVKNLVDELIYNEARNVVVFVKYL